MKQRPVGKDGAEFDGRKTTQQIAQIGADDSGNRDGKKIFHDGILSLQIGAWIL